MGDDEKCIQVGKFIWKYHESVGWYDADEDDPAWDTEIELLNEIERLRAVVDALVARPFRGTSSERRDRMYGSDWESVHDALDALEARRG